MGPTDIFISRGHQELLARLRHAIDTSSLAVITGPVGSGKSTAIRSIIHALEPSRYRYIYLASSELTPAQYYKVILHRLHIQPSRAIGENKQLVMQTMLETHQKGIKPIVLIDEAQDLALAMLSELKYILNYQVDAFSPLMVILCGQPRLAETLRLQVLESIRQRINVYYRLPCLSDDEIGPYILHHLKLAGMDRQIFDDKAIELIYQCSKGIPRRINNICRYAIVAAVVADSAVVNAEAVQKGLQEEELV